MGCLLFYIQKCAYFYILQNKILRKCFYWEKILSSHKNIKNHFQMVWHYNVSKATELKEGRHEDGKNMSPWIIFKLKPIQIENILNYKVSII